MSESAVQTLFRCGVCLEMFTSSEDCYSHIITHEVGRSTEQETSSVQIEGVSGPEDIAQQDIPSIEGDVPEQAEDESQMINMINYGENEVSADIGETVEGGVTVSVTSTDQSSVLDVLRSVETAAASVNTAEEVPAHELWVGKVGEELQGQKADERSTNEDLDIADILINIKQEKTEEVPEEQAALNMQTNDLVQLTNQIAQGSAPIYLITNPKHEQKKVPTTRILKAKKEKKKKNVSTQVRQERIMKNSDTPVPVVRRKKRGEENQDEDDNYYACTVCGKRYAILKSLKYHERTHDIENLHYCNVCNKGFVKPSELVNHERSHLLNKDAASGDIDMFKCRYCSKEYRIKKSLKHHEKVHELGNRYACDQCDKKFFKPSDLERHKKVHMPLAKCYICSKPFRDPKKLEIHVRQHPELLLQENEPRLKSTSLTHCKYCNKKCTTFSQLCNHVRTHTKRKPFPCDICGKMFNRVSNMRLHRKLHSGKKPFNCQQCGISFADFANRKRHMTKYHNSDAVVQVNYKPRCSKVAVVENLPPAPKLKVQREMLVNELCSAYEDLDVIKNKPGNESDVMKSVGQKAKNLIQCREVQGIPQQVQEMITVGNCQIQMPPNVLSNTDADTPETSSEQVYVVFEDNPSVCYVLEYEGDKSDVKSTESQEKTMVEQTTMTDDVDSFDIGFTNQGAQKHEKVTISADDFYQADGAEGLPLDDGDEPERNDTTHKTQTFIPSKTNKFSLQRHTCGVCGLKFKHQGSLKFHMKKHTKEGVMYCEVCKAEFYRKSRLRVHMREHTGERPYKCAECGRTFRVHYDLTVHTRQHTGYGAIPCNHCDKVFYTRRSLNAHLRNQSNEKPFSCSRCGKLFKRKDQRRRHMLIHFGKLPFKCHICERSFGDTSNRKRHIIKNHGTEALKTLPKGRISLVKSLKV